MVKRVIRPWYRRPFSWLLVLVPLLAVGRLLLTPALEMATERRLPTLAGHPVQFHDADVSLFPPVYALNGVAVGHRHEGRPLLSADRIEARLTWRSLLAGAPQAWVRLDGARWTGTGEGLPLVDVGTALGRLGDVRVESVEIARGELYLPRATYPWVTAGRAHVQWAGGTVKVNGTGKTLGDGALVFEATLPASDPTAMTGQIGGRGVPVGTLDAYGVRVTTPPPIGAFDVAARFDVRGGRLGGAVMPVKSTVAVAVPPGEMVASMRAQLAAFAPGVRAQRTENPAGRPALVSGVVPSCEGCLIPNLGGVLRVFLTEGLALALERPPVGDTVSVSDAGILEQ